MKNYRILRLVNACHYPGVEKHYLNRINPNYSSQSYAEQKSIWDSQFYVYGNSFSYWMKSLGNDAVDVVVDSVPLQSAWARDNGIDVSSGSWLLDTALAQIAAFKPEILYLQDVHSIPANVRKQLKSIFPFLKSVIIFRGYPGGSLSYFADFCDADLILVGAPHLVEKFALLGQKAHLVYHSFDHRINRFIDKVPEEQKMALSFIGTLGFGTQAHQERAMLLNYISERSNFVVYSDDPWKQGSVKLKTVDALGRAVSLAIQNPMVKSIGGKVLRYKHRFPMALKSIVKKLIVRGRVTPQELSAATKILPGIHGLTMYQALANSKISFNVHSNAGRGTVENMRMFQAPGVGSCLLTDWGRNITDLFEPDNEVVCYKTPEECIDKLKQLQSNEKLRAEIARNGQLRILKDHTAEKRMQQIQSIIEEAL